VVVEHDIPLVSSVSDRLLAMDLGRVIALGPPDEVLADSAVVSAYFGGAPEEVIRRSGQRHNAAREVITT
jgi:ABC-type hemin transport system ATPase subunit